jgi:hypothetical protein
MDWKAWYVRSMYLEPLKTDKDLDPLRSRPDFRALLAQVKAAAKPAGK